MYYIETQDGVIDELEAEQLLDGCIIAKVEDQYGDFHFGLFMNNDNEMCLASGDSLTYITKEDELEIESIRDPKTGERTHAVMYAHPDDYDSHNKVFPSLVRKKIDGFVEVWKRIKE